MGDLPGNDSWAEFFSEGFFGYGEKGDFTYFSFWHFLPIILLIAGIILTYKFRDKIRNSKHEKTFRLIMGMVMMFAEMGYFWRLLYIGNSDLGEHTLLTRLPFQVCEWTCIFAIFMVLTENKHFFDIDVVVCLTLGITPLFMPAVIQRTGPRYFRYYQFWLEHILPIYAVFYMMFVKGFKYNVKTVYKPLIFLVILSLICMYFNAKIPEATYMYLQGDDLGEAITNMLPPTQYGRFFVFMGLGVVLFALHFLVFFLIRRAKSKKEETKTEEVAA